MPGQLISRRTGLIAASLGVAAVLLISWIFTVRNPEIASLKRCIGGKGCQGIVVLSGAKRLTAASLDAIMKAPEVSSVAINIYDTKTVATSSGSTSFFVADVGTGPQMFPVMEISTSEGSAFLLGSVLSNIYRVAILKENPSIKTLGPLNRELGERMSALIPVIQSQGVRTIEVAGTQSVPVEEVRDAYQKLAEHNWDTPLKTFRP